MVRPKQGDVTFKLRSGTPDEWARKNPILAPDEPGMAIGAGNFKVGDGRTRWNDLPWFIDLPDVTPGDDSAALAALQAHISAEEPHPAYDEGPSFFLLYQNAKV